MHEGLKDAGLTPRLLWACEIDEAVMDHAAAANPSWDAETVALGMPLQHLAFADDYTLQKIPKPVLLEAGLPCTAASLSGRAKKGLAKPEDDPKAGHLVAAFIALIARVNPSAIVLENVEAWFTSASASILRTQLLELGYRIEEKVLEGRDYAIEARVRKVLVAVTEGVEIDLASMIAPPRSKQTVGEILEAIPDDDPQWSTMDYLKAKEERDKADGKGFAMQRITPDAEHVGCIGRGYMKRRSTEPMLAHPTSPDHLRLFTPIEHARLKGIPTALIDGIESRTFAHEVLGQSCVWPSFRHLGEVLGRALKAYTTRRDDAPPPFALASAA
jgi:DNA (cytosine-5)-methyltransferase 1